MGGSTLPPAPDYFTTFSTDHFNVKYNPSGKVPLTKTIDESMGAYGKVDTFFYGYHNKTTLVVAESNNEFRVVTGIGNIPENATALDFNDGARGVVAIKSPDLLPNYKQILTYHMARIMERTILEVYHSPPKWFQDGLAAYVASDITDKQRAQAEEYARTEQWMSLPKLESVYDNMTVYNEGSPETKAAKAQAFLLVEYVGSSYGNRTLVNILADFGYSGNINKSFLNCTSQLPEKFNQDAKSTLIGPVTTPTPIPEVEAREYVSGYVRDGTGNPLTGNKITFTGDDTNTSAVTDKSGYYAAEVSFGLLNVNMKGANFEYNNTIPVNQGENKVFNITISGLNVNKENQPLLPTVQLPAIPAVSLNTSLTGIAIILANIVAGIVVVWVLRRNWV